MYNLHDQDFIKEIPEERLMLHTLIFLPSQVAALAKYEITRWQKICRVLLGVGFLFVLDSGARGEETATLRGSVLSISGSPVAQAVLTVEDVSSTKALKTETDARGEYELRGLAPGRYRLIVSAVGFLTQQRKWVALEAGETTREEFRVEPSPVGSQQREDTTTGQSQSAVATTIIDESELVGLPMNGRSYTQLLTLQAGVSDPSGGGRQGGQSSSITVSGGRGEWNAFMLDGTDINGTDNRVPRSAAGGQLGADAVLQVQIFSANYGAQYGRAAGGVMNAITRSGSNEWHGGLFEFLRNSKMDAHDFFDPPEKPPFKRNQFGATVTGPMIREKTFFMTSFEVLLNRLTQNVVSFVPDNEARRGILSLPGREPIIANTKVLPYLALYPLPQVPLLDRNGDPTGVAENRTSARLPTSEYFFAARIDQRLSNHDALFGRYTFDDADQMAVGSTAELPWRIKSRQQYLTLAETHFFSPTLLNTFRASYTRPTSTFNSAHAREIPRSLFFVPSAPRYGQLHVAGLTRFAAHFDAPAGKTMNSFQFADDLIYRSGSHTWKLGTLIERFQWNVFDNHALGGIWTFSSLENLFRLGEGTKLKLALPGSSSERDFRQTLLGFYFQDDYQLRPNIALSLGLRYEFTTKIHDTRGRDVYLLDVLLDSEPRLGQLMSSNPSLRNLAPRFGLSWSPGNDRRTQVRAGVGIYHEPLLEYTVENLRRTLPFYKYALRPNFEALETFPDAVAAARGDAGQLRIFDYHNPKNPVIYRYNLSLQRQLTPRWTAEISYVGARGNHLLRTFEANLYPFAVRQPDGKLFLPPDPEWVKPDGNLYCSSDPNRPQTPPDSHEPSLRPNFEALETFPDAVAAARGDAGQLRIFDYHNPKNPVIYRYNLSLQRQLTPRWTAEISYVGARGNHLLRTFEANLYPFAVRQPDGKLFLPPDPEWVKPDGNLYSSSDPNRPQTPPDNVMNPAFGSIQRTLTDAQSFYNSGYVSINGDFGRNFTLGANYTYSKSVDDASSVRGLQEHYGLDRKLNRGLSTFDRRHNFSLRYFYSPPIGSGQRWFNSGWLSSLIGGWRFGGILSLRSGSAFGVSYGIPSTGFLFVSQRPNLTPFYNRDPTNGVTAGCRHPLTGQMLIEPDLKLGGPDLYFDPCAFQPPEPGYIGDAGRTTLTGPGIVNLDFSLQKEFRIDSERNLQFRAEFFNLANHPNFQAPGGPPTAIFRDGGTINPSAGKIRSTATTPRQIQFALRLSF